MNITHVIENLADTYGGPARSLPELVDQLNKLGIVNTILTVRKSKDEAGNSLALEYGLKVLYEPASFPFFGYASIGMLKRLVNICAKSSTSLVHFHSMWSLPSFIGVLICIFYKVPFAISPRSSIYPKSLQKRATTKRLILSTYYRKCLNKAVFFHATEPDEARCAAALGYKGKIYTIPHGINTKEFLALDEPNIAKQTLSLSSDKSFILCLARVHPRKNQLLLLKSFAKISAEFPDFDLILAGPIEDKAYHHKLLEYCKAHDISERVHLLGMVTGCQRKALFASVRFSVLLSEFENFGMSIGESLAAGIPIIVSPFTPWTLIDELGIGQTVELTPCMVEAALRHFITIPEAQINKIKSTAKEFIVNEYSWGNVASTLAACYEESLNVRKKASFSFNK